MKAVLLAVIHHEATVSMIKYLFELPTEQWRLICIIVILIFYQPIYRLFGRLMDRISGVTSSKSAVVGCRKPPLPFAQRPPSPSSPEAQSNRGRVSSFHRRLLSSGTLGPVSVATDIMSPSSATTSRSSGLSLGAAKAVRRVPAQPAQPAPPPADTETGSGPSTKHDAARTVKRYLISITRDDWEYPSSLGERGPTLPSGRRRKPVGYRIRDGDEVSSDPDAVSDHANDSPNVGTGLEKDPYKFENPDAVASCLTEQQRKRRKLEEEERQWNDGLRLWTERRNAWCGAFVKENPAAAGPHRSKFHGDVHGNISHEPRSPSESLSRSHPTSPQSPQSLQSLQSVESAQSDTSDSSSEDSEEESEAARSLFEAGEALLPVYPSLIHNKNTVRGTMKPSMYPTLYSKIVVQGLTPAIPVPLADMVGSLVQGWKNEGVWPGDDVNSTTARESTTTTPTNFAVATHAGKRRSELLKFRRRRTTHDENGRMRKGVGAVKKALRLMTTEDEVAKAGPNCKDWEGRETIVKEEKHDLG